MPVFCSNYPNFQPGRPTLLPIAQRMQAQEHFRGRGVVIAFIDSGFYPHPDLADRIILHVDASTNRVVEQPDGFSVSDLSWHGQMTTVIACGSGQRSGGRYRGLAPEARLVLIKVSTPKGLIKEADILRGLRWLIDTHRRLNIRLVNVSVGGDDVSTDPNHPIHRAIRKLVTAGVTVVVAAGNRPVEHLLPPASSVEAITVGGLDDGNTTDRSQWSLYHHNYGTAFDGRTRKPDLLAAARWIVSPVMPGTSVDREARWLGSLLEKPTQQQFHAVLKRGYGDLGLSRAQALAPDEHLHRMLQNRINAHKLIDRYHQHVDGTSVAAPIVTSVIAQMLQANPGLTPQTIRDILTRTARPLAHCPITLQGAGALDAGAAVQMALQFKSS